MFHISSYFAGGSSRCALRISYPAFAHGTTSQTDHLGKYMAYQFGLCEMNS